VFFFFFICILFWLLFVIISGSYCYLIRKITITTTVFVFVFTVLYFVRVKGIFAFYYYFFKINNFLGLIINLEYIFSFDNISYMFVFLTTILIPTCILSSWVNVSYNSFFIIFCLLFWKLY
jgi:NADH:ubiquinone oxidoreductase subunit 4 (subunit M)